MTDQQRERRVSFVALVGLGAVFLIVGGLMVWLIADRGVAGVGWIVVAGGVASIIVAIAGRARDR